MPDDKHIWKSDFNFGNRCITMDSTCYVIAEIGGNFNGSYDLAVRSIDAAAACGADAVKFQTYKAEELVSDPGLMYTYRELDGRNVTVSQLEMFRQMELPFDWHASLRDHAHSKGVEFLSSAADVESAELLISLAVPVMKIASDDLINVPVVERIATSGLPTLLSTGMADEEEIAGALDVFARAGNDQVMLLHCTSQYPTPLRACNLRRIEALRERFGTLVGFSDHTEGWEASALAVSLGARVLEKHFTLDQTLPGPDHGMSTAPKGFGELVEKIRSVETMLGRRQVKYTPEEEAARTEYRRSIVARCDIPAGTVIQENMLAYRRPGGGLHPYQRYLLLNKKSNSHIHINQKITLNNVTDMGNKFVI